MLTRNQAIREINQLIQVRSQSLYVCRSTIKIIDLFDLFFKVSKLILPIYCGVFYFLNMIILAISTLGAIFILSILHLILRDSTDICGTIFHLNAVIEASSYLKKSILKNYSESEDLIFKEDIKRLESLKEYSPP